MTLDSFARGPRAYATLALVALALYLPGIARLPITDRDEARFAQATRQMLETGDYIHIRFQDRARNKKPIAIHWLQAAAVKAAAGGETGEIWAYRLPSLLGAAAAVLALFALAGQAFGPGTAFLGALILASALITVVEAHLAKTDAVLLLLTVLAQGALLAIYARGRENKRAPPALAMTFWGAIGAGILVKGPVLPFIAATTLAALWIADRRAGLTADLRRGLRPALGLVLCLAIALPWFLATGFGRDGFILDAVKGDLLPKLLGGQESHGAPPGYYLGLVPLTLWPGALLLPFGLIWAWRNRLDPGPRFCLAWLIPAWVVLELVPTKLPHYVLPLYPAAALMTAQSATDGRDWLISVMGRWPAWLWLLVWALAGLALAALLPIAAVLTDAPAPSWTWWASGAALVALGIGAIATILRKPLVAITATAPAMALFTGLAFAGALPGMFNLWPSDAARDLVATSQRTADPPVAVAGYHEPSLVFTLGTKTVLTSPDGAAKYLAGRPKALALIERRVEAKFRGAASALGLDVQGLGAVRCFNLSKGRIVTLTLYRAEPAKP